MQTHIRPADERFNRLRGRVPRSRSIGTKLTPAEEREILAAAEAQGKAPSEWTREVLLREVRGSASMPSGPVMLTEIVGLHLFLINVLSPIARGERITQEHYQEIIRHVREHKHGAAAEILGTPGLDPAEVRK